MLGYPGAGKTTTAEIIAKLTGAVRLTSDQERLKMFSQPEFTPEEHAKLYQALDERTEKLLKNGQSVIYDANLNRHTHRQDKYEICRRVGAKPTLIWLNTPRQLAKDRAVHDSRHHLVPKNETPTDMFERIADIIEPPLPGEEAIELDGTNLDEETVRQILAAHSLL